jgi:hypothetical protein
MSRYHKLIRLTFCVILVTLLAVPTIQGVTNYFPRRQLYGYIEPINNRPSNLLRSFFNKSLQAWIEKYFDVNLGFREYLIRSFNEINFRLFQEAPRLRLLSTNEHGLYSKMSIDNLNDEVIRRKELEQKYKVEAQKLFKVQQIFRANNKYFEVLISSSKPYVYPHSLGSRYLVDNSKNIFQQTASFGNVLKSTGVNVTDSGPELRKLVEESTIETHPASGVHWNYYAGCMIARQILDNARQRRFPELPNLDCGLPQSNKPYMVDVDGLRLLNIWSDGGLMKPSLYPSIVSNQEAVWRPNIVLIGDSFSDQISYAFKQANVYARMVTSGYFRVREVDDHVNGNSSNDDIRIEESVIREKLAEDIAESDVIILQMVDYNVPRWGYGFADYVLSNPLFNGRGKIRISSAAGAYDRESDEINWWHWVEHKVNFKLKSMFVPDDTLKTTLSFEYGTRGKQSLSLHIINRNGTSQEVLLKSNGEALEKFSKVVDIPPIEIAEISIETDGIAFPLGNGDHRVAALIIRNLDITPLFP